ncbi:MAG: ATP-binding cassette domain-containing protein, partial [Bacillota bacterium]|nr:ATP-binding cassette domain-containing protein [Bacillota bacterium]
SVTETAAVLFLEDRLLPWLNVWDNIALSRLGWGAGEDREKRIDQLAEMLEIDDIMYMLPDELSGGMKHRVAMARTFFADGDLIILDEPFRGLDAQLKERITEGLWKKETEGKTVLLITHIPEDAERLASKIIRV